MSGFVGFPIPFCMKALEEQEDNIERAADWALLNMEQYSLNHPELFVDDAFEEMSASDDELMQESALSTTDVLHKSTEATLTDTAQLSHSNANISPKPVLAGWKCYAPQHAWQSDAYSDEMVRVDRAHERMWSDKARPALVAIDEVHVGCYYKVAEVSEAYRESLPLWLKTMDRTMSKIGVARAVDKQRLLVRLKFYNEDDMTTSSYWYPVSILDPIHNWRQDNQPNPYSAQHIEAIDDVQLLEEIAIKSEADVTAVLLNQLALQLVHHVADSRTLMTPQVDVLATLLPLLNHCPATLLDSPSPALAQLTRAIAAHIVSPQSLAHLLTVACNKLASGAQFSLQQTVTHESDHPFNYQKYLLAQEPAHHIHVPGAHHLYIHFDARSKLSQYDVLSFYSDSQSTHLIARYNQRVGKGRQITYSSFTPLVQNLFELSALMTQAPRSLADKLSDKMVTEADEEDNKRPRKRSKSNAVEWWKWAFDRCVDSVPLLDYFSDRSKPIPASVLYGVWLDSQSFDFTMTPHEVRSINCINDTLLIPNFRWRVASYF